MFGLPSTMRQVVDFKAIANDFLNFILKNSKDAKYIFLTGILMITSKRHNDETTERVSHIIPHVNVPLNGGVFLSVYSSTLKNKTNLTGLYSAYMEDMRVASFPGRGGGTKCLSPFW
jgi:hypothetical protein